MNLVTGRIIIAILTIFQIYAVAFAGTLDDYYLQQFGEMKNVQLQKAVLSVLPEAQKSARCGMPLKKGLRRDWDLLEQSTQKVLAKQLAKPVLSGTAQTFISPSGAFKIHYTNTGSDAVPSFAWVQTVAQTFDDVASSYSVLGWQAVPTNSNSPYDVYLRNLASERLYGVTNSDVRVSSASGYPNAYSSWVELDNDFTEVMFTNPGGGGIFTPLQSLQITAAHEYHHAIQYGYNYYFDIWYAEATSTWMEDELYDNVNQLYNYIPEWFANGTLSLDIPESTSTGGGYGRWIFNRYLAEEHGQSTIRAIWESATGIPSPDGNSDIQMTPILEDTLSSRYGVSLGDDFFGFTKRIYTREWSTHTSEIDKIHVYSPISTFSTYPVTSTTVILPHHSFVYYRFTPPTTSSLTISLAKTSGIRATLFKKNSINGAISEVTATGGTSYTVSGFDEAVLLIVNTTDVDNHMASFSTDGNTQNVQEPTGGSVYGTTGGSGSATSTDSKGGGCFIATAAYGSYLHPQVQLLRNFRDDCLLTNAPGRAFVAFYYRYSPPLADLIASHPLLRGISRLFLTPIVVAVIHPALSGGAILLAIVALYRPVRRRFYGMVGYRL